MSSCNSLKGFFQFLFNTIPFIDRVLRVLYGLVADLSGDFHKVIYNFRHYRSFLRIIRAEQ